jgi:5-formaminoimidazole-4-carboxamide-1-beta-D-ribofuranosyl 5'-monophosphate synthetase
MSHGVSQDALTTLLVEKVVFIPKRSFLATVKVVDRKMKLIRKIGPGVKSPEQNLS